MQSMTPKHPNLSPVMQSSIWRELEMIANLAICHGAFAGSFHSTLCLLPPPKHKGWVCYFDDQPGIHKGVPRAHILFQTLVDRLQILTHLQA